MLTINRISGSGDSNTQLEDCMKIAVELTDNANSKQVVVLIT